MAIIDVVKWDAPPNVFAWKYPSCELSSWTQLIVNESQEALMFREGKAVGPFTAGRHILSSDNYPVLNSLLKIPFGRSPYTAEVWFVQKAFKLNIRWGTSTPIQVADPQYHVMLPVRAFGQYGISISDTAKFLVKLVGTLPAFTDTTLTDYFKGILITRAKDIIAKYIIEQKISILQITAHLNEISEKLQNQIASEFEDYGLQIINFTVNSISTNDNDPAVIKLRDALASRAEMDIMGFNYQQKRSFDTMQAAAENTGSGSGVMNAGIGMGMGLGLGVPMGGAVQQLSSSLNTSNPNCSNSIPCPKCQELNLERAKFCSSCASPMTATSKNDKTSSNIKCDKCGTTSPKGTNFCPECGDIFYLCPKCGADNPDNASICINCGEALPIKCPNCKTPIASNLKFCGECGKSLSTKCQNCGESLSISTKFCKHCGTKI